MSERFDQERVRARRLWLGLLAIGGVLSIPIFRVRLDWAGTQLSATAVQVIMLRPALTATQLKARDEYWSSRQGLSRGVASGAFASAIQHVNDEKSDGTVRKLSDTELASAFSWRFLGPDPISLLTYFTSGVVFPNPPQAHSGAGSFSALAVDSSGNIFAGSADGGVYLSSDGGDTFSQISMASQLRQSARSQSIPRPIRIRCMSVPVIQTAALIPIMGQVSSVQRTWVAHGRRLCPPPSPAPA